MITRMLEVRGELQSRRGFTAVFIFPHLQEALLIFGVHKRVPLRLGFLGGLLLFLALGGGAGLAPQGSERAIQSAVIEG
eukprot:9502056-Pyramimonas_sp.AAC.1